MQIIVRTCGERTTNKCVELASIHGPVTVVNARPFGESIRQTYEIGYKMSAADEWVAVIDADVLLFAGSLRKGLKELLNSGKNNVFCYDGQTNDKVLMKNRRAGVHIYRTKLLKKALDFIDNDQLKPETYVRKCMNQLGFCTFIGETVFGKHDFEQFFRDLWRKSVCQAHKLPKQTEMRRPRWKELSKHDPDYKVIFAGNLYGTKIHEDHIKIDIKNDFDADENIKKLGLTEKGALI